MTAEAGSVNKKKSRDQEKVEHKFLFLEIPVQVVAPAVMGWEASPWWPAKAGIRITKKSDGPVREGTRYQYQLEKLPLPAFEATVTRWTPDRGMERTFQPGPVIGGECVRIEERANGTRVDYELRHRVEGFMPKLLWNVFGRKKYTAAMKNILDTFKIYIEKEYQQQQERRLEAP